MTVPDRDDKEPSQNRRGNSNDNITEQTDFTKTLRFAASDDDDDRDNLIASGEDTDDYFLGEPDAKDCEVNFSGDDSAPSSPNSLYTPSFTRKILVKPSKEARRAFLKSGQCNIQLSSSSLNNRHYFQDLMTTLVECRWRYAMLALVLSFFLSWLAFAVLWYIVAAAHGDLAWQKPAASHEHCIRNMNDAAGCFLFSMESQTTVGYGVLHPSVECPEAIFLLCMQSIFGLLIQTIAVGIVFAKLARPRQRSAAILFSQNAVINLRQGHLCLQVRVVDLRRPLLGVRATMVMLGPARARTAEGQRIPLQQTLLPVSIDEVGNEPILAWPLTLYHRIDSSSPLYKVTPAGLARADLEFVVTLEGSSESTGQPTRCRTSYLASEILWGYRFAPVLRMSRERQKWIADASQLDKLEPPDTSRPALLLSAKHWDLSKQQQQQKTAAPAPAPAQSPSAAFLYDKSRHSLA